VDQVDQAMDFYTRAFGIERGFLHESGQYGEMKTGQTTLAFAAKEMLTQNLGLHAEPRANHNIEIAFSTTDVAAAFKAAVDTGAKALAEPTEKPWGQIVSYVQDPYGTLVELCTPMA
jgi:uncharacterized glyoxalase superfamily protein PhnB